MGEHMFMIYDQGQQDNNKEQSGEGSTSKTYDLKIT
jgi:hypothetical protein